MKQKFQLKVDLCKYSKLTCLSNNKIPTKNLEEENLEDLRISLSTQSWHSYETIKSLIKSRSQSIQS